MVLPDPALLSEFKRLARQGDFEAWVGHPDSTIRQLLAWWREVRLPRRVIARLAADNHYMVRTQLARRNDLPARILRQLASDSSWNVRGAVAENTAYSPALARFLARSKDQSIRSRVATNPATPHDVLEKLSHDKVVPVVVSVLRREDFVPSCLGKLADSRHYEVRSAVFRHPLLPEDIAESIAAEGNVNARAALAEAGISAQLRERLSRDPAEGVREVIARRKDVGEDTLERLSYDPNVRVRSFALSRLFKTEERLQRCLADPAQCVRLIAANSSHLSEVQMAELAMDPDPVIRRELLTRDLSPRLWMRLATDPDFPSVRQAAARAPRLPRECMDALVNDQDVGVRYVLALRPSLPQDILMRLRRDSHPAIAAKAMLGGGRRRTRPLAGPSPAPTAPEWLHPLSERRAKAVTIDAGSIPSDDLDCLAIDSSMRVRRAVASAELAALSGTARAALKADADWQVRADFAGRSDLCGDEAAALGRDVHVEVRVSLALNPGGARTRELLSELGNDRSTKVRVAAAKNPNAPAELIEQWTAKSPNGILWTIARRQDLTMKACRLIARRGMANTRSRLGSNESLSPETLLQLAELPRLHEGLSSNATLPGHCAEAMIEKISDKARASMAWRTDLSDAAMIRLAGDRCTAVREAIAGRRGLTLAAAQMLAADPVPSVVRRLCAADRLPPEIELTLACHPDVEIRKLMAERHHPLSDEAIACLAMDKSNGVKLRLARHWPLPEIAIRLLAEDSDPRVRAAIGDRHELPADIAQQLASDSDGYVRNSTLRALPPAEFARGLQEVMTRRAA